MPEHKPIHFNEKDWRRCDLCKTLAARLGRTEEHYIASRQFACHRFDRQEARLTAKCGNIRELQFSRLNTVRLAGLLSNLGR